MRDLVRRAMYTGMTLAACFARGQMHKVAKPEQVVRAVGVYEWTGDLTKPTASRLIPITVFIDGKLEDAGVYIARPVPFALLSGNVYELQDAGLDKGLLDLAYARHMQAEDAAGNTAYDDGWFGYGSFKPLAAARRPVKLKPSKTLPVLTSSASGTSHPQLGTKTAGTAAGDTTAGGTAAGGTSDPSTTGTKPGATTSASADDPDRPTMKRRSSGSNGSSGSGGDAGGAGDASGGTTASSGGTASDAGAASGSASTPADDPDRPTMKRRSTATDSSSGAGGTDSTASTASAGSTPADDPDRPTMKRRSSDTSTDGTNTSAGTASGAGTAGGGDTPSDDPDRPTLKRRSPEDAKKARSNGDLATVSGTGSLNDDPDRPNLHHGKPTSAMTETDLPKLMGMPVDLHQMVAVSDAANRDPHEFALSFDDAAERSALLTKMQGMARAQLSAYETSAGAAKPAVIKKTSVTTVKSRRAATAPAPEMLVDEELKAYTLSYGGAATYIYTAHTAGTGAALRYVTVVAQEDGLGELKPAIQSVTDAAHLDRTPRMRFVDVVDVEASNRASLLFELQGQSSRQFGLYRVIASHSEQIFLTGTTQ